MIEALFTHSGLSSDDIDLYAVSSGPGSFTGVRIGVSTAKGLAFKNGTPCVGVSSLEALAANFAGIDGIIVPAIDTRRDTVYTAIFKSHANGSLERLTEDLQIEINELFYILSKYTETVYFTGDAYGSLVSRDKNFSCAQTPEKLRRQSAYGVCKVCYELYTKAPDKGAFTDNNLVPVYLKKSQAERELEEKNKNNGDK